MFNVDEIDTCPRGRPSIFLEVGMTRAQPFSGLISIGNLNL